MRPASVRHVVGLAGLVGDRRSGGQVTGELGDILAFLEQRHHGFAGRSIHEFVGVQQFEQADHFAPVVEPRPNFLLFSISIEVVLLLNTLA